MWMCFGEYPCEGLGFCVLILCLGLGFGFRLMVVISGFNG